MINKIINQTVKSSKMDNSDYFIDDKACTNYNTISYNQPKPYYREEYDYDLISNYISEIEKINKANEQLEIQNNNLKMKIKEDKKDSDYLEEIKEIIKVKSYDDIISALNERNINDQKNIKDELIGKMSILYKELTGDRDCNIKKLWEWVRALITMFGDLTNDKEAFEEESKMFSKNNIYKEYWSDLMKQYNLHSFEDLQNFINKLLAKNKFNEQQMRKIKSNLECDNTQ